MPMCLLFHEFSVEPMPFFGLQMLASVAFVTRICASFPIHIRVRPLFALHFPAIP